MGRHKLFLRECGRRIQYNTTMAVIGQRKLRRVEPAGSISGYSSIFGYSYDQLRARGGGGRDITCRVYSSCGWASSAQVLAASGQCNWVGPGGRSRDQLAYRGTRPIASPLPQWWWLVSLDCRQPAVWVVCITESSASPTRITLLSMSGTPHRSHIHAAPIPQFPIPVAGRPQ